MTDNFLRLPYMMDWSDQTGDLFYLIHVLQRKKDIPDLEKSTRIIKTYTVTTLDYFAKIRDEIKIMCDTFHARAYMYINRRSYKNTARHMLKTLADNFASDSFRGITHLFTSEAAAHGIGDKLWILDVDLLESDGSKVDMEDLTEEAQERIGQGLHNRLWNRLDNIQPVDQKKLKGYMQTKHGYHFITSPFDTREVQRLQEATDFLSTLGLDADIELKKDAMVNLYIP